MGEGGVGDERIRFQVLWTSARGRGRRRKPGQRARTPNRCAMATGGARGAAGAGGRGMGRVTSKKASGVAGSRVGRKSKQHALQTFPLGKAGQRLGCAAWKIWGPTVANLKCQVCEGNRKLEHETVPVRGAFGKRCLAAG